LDVQFKTFLLHNPYDCNYTTGNDGNSNPAPVIFLESNVNKCRLTQITVCIDNTVKVFSVVLIRHCLFRLDLILTACRVITGQPCKRWRHFRLYSICSTSCSSACFVRCWSLLCTEAV